MLTPSAVPNAKPQAKPYKLADERGMYLLVKPDRAALSKPRTARTRIAGAGCNLNRPGFPGGSNL